MTKPHWMDPEVSAGLVRALERLDADRARFRKLAAQTDTRELLAEIAGLAKDELHGIVLERVLTEQRREPER